MAGGRRDLGKAGGVGTVAEVVAGTGRMRTEMTAVTTMTAGAADVSSPAMTTSQASSGPHGRRPALSSHCLRSP
eukprot:4951725-Alexandrium_andersonii.AAC.1